jgi:flavin-dependent trigonelline monooxygenase, oxygenase component
MPRPQRRVPLMLAVLVPEGIYHCARKGYNIQTTPLGAAHEILVGQVEAFVRGRDECPSDLPRPRLSLQRGLFAARDDAHARRILEQGFAYYQRFDNVYTGPGQVSRGFIDPLPRKQGMEELGANLLIATPSELVDKLANYAELGIDEVIASSNFGQCQAETVEMMQRLSEEVFPHLDREPLRAHA